MHGSITLVLGTDRGNDSFGLLLLIKLETVSTSTSRTERTLHIIITEGGGRERRREGEREGGREGGREGEEGEGGWEGLKIKGEVKERRWERARYSHKRI